ncbi:hypothetical protein Enr13x_20690 [Stieleria neptunia]|uniref:Uncharacterized protein n=1 Tax=Stieleria neptunia TaxID=2527979 RepID=A0A518HMZ6_9BACT|nr:hypothetical protein [Stieleria neptunia]QDV42224.1 hypothetical protein Enr13x_20690 [Stieleria neptunia]
MKQRSNVLTNGVVFRQAREKRLLTIEEVPNAIDENGIDPISKNSVWKVEAGGPVSFKTAKILCEFYELEPRVVRLENGKLLLEPEEIPNELSDVVRHVKKMVMKDVSIDTDGSELIKRLEALKDLLGEEVVRLSNFRAGSIHFDMEVSDEAVDRIESLFATNEQGEYEVPDLLDEDVYMNLKNLLSVPHSAKGLLAQATEMVETGTDYETFKEAFFGADGLVREAFPTDAELERYHETAESRIIEEMVHSLREEKVATSELAKEVAPQSYEERCRLTLLLAEEAFAKTGSWVVFFRQILGVDGVVRQLFGTRDELARFVAGPEFTTLHEMLAAIRSQDQTKSDAAEPERMITIRIPRSLHDVLQQESKDWGLSINKLCISKLLQAIDSRFIPEPQESRRRTNSYASGNENECDECTKSEDIGRDRTISLRILGATE